MKIRTGKYGWLCIVALLLACVVLASRARFHMYNGSQDDEHAGHDHAAHAAHDADEDADNHDDHEEAGHDEDEDDQAEHEEAGHDEDEDEHGEDAPGEGIIRLEERELKAIGLSVQVAKAGKIAIETRLLGKVRINEEKLAHVVPLVSGIALKVNRRVGDEVEKGDVLAIIASRELAEIRAAFFLAEERQALSAKAYERENQLRKKKISSEQEFLDAKQALAETEIELLAAKQSLLALGIPQEEWKQAGGDDSGKRLTRYEIRAALSGTVIEQHMTIGEKVGEDEVFVIADLASVWVDLDVSQKDLGSIRKHQAVTISASGVDVPDVDGEIGFVSPIIDEATRTAVARVVIPNADGKWRPGLFVTALLSVAQAEAGILVVNDALQTLEGESVIFVPDEGGFKSQSVKIGRSSRTHTEIKEGLQVGQEYVSKGAFELKAKIVTSGLDPHAGHGH
jgi:cobalt-zinc-cadmium efflux system membrane fusion protein